MFDHIVAHVIPKDGHPNESWFASLVSDISSSRPDLGAEILQHRPFVDPDSGQLGMLLSLRCTLPPGKKPGESDIIQALESMPMVLSSEAWVTAPCFVPIDAPSVGSMLFSEPSSGAMITAYRKLGMFCVSERLSDLVLENLKGETRSRISRIEAAIRTKKPDIRMGSDTFAFLEIGSRGDNRFDLLFEEGDPESPTVSGVMWANPWISMIRSLIPTSEQLKCATSVVYSLPGAPNQAWHADGRHMPSPTRSNDPLDPDGLPEYIPPYAICVFVPLIPLTEITGFTQFWPGTHRCPKLLGFGGAAEIMSATVDGIVPAGAAVVYDYRLMHRGMANATKDTVRPVLQFLYHVASYSEVKNYGSESLLA